MVEHQYPMEVMFCFNTKSMIEQLCSQWLPAQPAIVLAAPSDEAFVVFSTLSMKRWPAPPSYQLISNT
eukprot:COSAG05_NODE_414_length_10051_cov_120.012158_2_plen_68_part_00